MFNTLLSIQLSLQSASFRVISVFQNHLSRASSTRLKALLTSRNSLAASLSTSQNSSLVENNSSTSILYTFDHGESLFLPVYNTQFHVIVNKANQALTLTSRPPFIQKGYKPLIPIFLDKSDALDFFYKCFYAVNHSFSKGKYRLGIEKVNIKAYDLWASNNKNSANIVHVVTDSSKIFQLPIYVRNSLASYCPKVEVVLSKTLIRNISKIRSNKISFRTVGPLEDLFSSNYYNEMLIDSEHSRIHKKEISNRNSLESDFRYLLELRSKCSSLISDFEDAELKLWYDIKRLKTGPIKEKLEMFFNGPEKNFSKDKDDLDSFIRIIKRDEFYSFSRFFFQFLTTGVVVKYFYPELLIVLAQLESINTRKKSTLSQLMICESKLMSILINRYKNLLKYPISKVDIENEQVLSKKIEQFNQLHLADMYGFHIYIDGKLSKIDPTFLKLEDLSDYIGKNSENRFTKDTNLTIKIDRIPGDLIKQHLMNNKIVFN